MNKFFSYIKDNKIKISFGACLITSVSIIIGKNFKNIKNCVNLINDFLSFEKMKVLEKNNQNSIFGKIKSDKKLNEFVSTILDKELKISETKHLISTSQNEELIHNWEIFKEKIFISFFSSFFLLKFLSLISLTNATVLNLFISKNKIDYYKSIEILNALWDIAKVTSPKIIQKIITKIQKAISSITINQKLTYEQIEEILNNIYNDITQINPKTNTLELFDDYEKEIEQQIDSLEKNDYDIANITNINDTNSKLIVYSTNYDIITSKIFTSVLYSTFNKDLIKNLAYLKTKFTSNQQSLAKILLFLDEIKINLIQSDADMDDIVSEYITIISNIIFK